MDDGKIKITVSYEDEDGVISTMEKEMTLFVTEEVPMDFDSIDVGNMVEVEPEQGFFARHKVALIAAAVLAAGGIAGFTVWKKQRRKKRLQAEAEEIDDEIS